MGNKTDKLVNPNKDLNIKNMEKNKLDELIKNYLISEKEKNPKIKKLIMEYYQKTTIKNNEKSNLNQAINSNKFIEFSLLLANQVQIKALEKDLNFNFDKCFLLNSHAIQLCSVEDTENNIIFDSKSAMLQMNAYNKRFEEEYTDMFIKREVKRYDTLRKKIKDELQFEKDMDEEIKNLRKSKEYSSDALNEKDSEENNSPNTNNNFIIKRDDLSLQEYLNIETKRLKKDRSKLSESIKLNNKNCENHEENELVIYKNFEDKDLDIKNGKKNFKFEKKGIDVDTNYDYMNPLSFKSSSMKNSKEKFFTSKHDSDIQKVYMKESSQNFNTTNSSKFNKSRTQQDFKNSAVDFSSSKSKLASPNKAINFNLLRNKHLEKNNKTQTTNIMTYNNYNTNNSNNQNKNVNNQSINKGKSSVHMQTPNKNKSILAKNDIEATNKNKPLSVKRKNSTATQKNLKEKYSIKTDYNTYINGKNFSERKNYNDNFNNISKKNQSIADNLSSKFYLNSKIKSASAVNLNLIPDDMDLLVTNNFAKSNKNAETENLEFPKDKDFNKNYNNKNNYGCNLDNNKRNTDINIKSNRSHFTDNSKDDLINHYSKDLDKIFNAENEIKEICNNNNNNTNLSYNLKTNLKEKKLNNDIPNKNKQNIKQLNDINSNNYNNLVYMTENNYEYDKSQVNLNTSQNKNNKNYYKNINTSINAANNNYTSRNMASKYNFTSFNQTLSKNSNFISNNSNKISNRYERNEPTLVKAATNNFSSYSNNNTNNKNNLSARKTNFNQISLQKLNTSLLPNSSFNNQFALNNNLFNKNNNINNTSLNLNTTNKLSKTPAKPSIRIDIRELMKKELPETRRSEKIVEDCDDDDHEKSNGNLIIENINQNNQVNNVDLQIFQFLNKMKQNNNNDNNEIENNDKDLNDANADNKNDEDKNNNSNDSLDNLIIKNQKEMISNYYSNNNVNKYASNLKVSENLSNNAVVIEEKDESEFADKEINFKNNFNNYDNNNDLNKNLNKSASGISIKLKIDDNDEVIIEEEY